MNRFAPILVTAILVVPAVSFAAMAPWPAGALEKNDPRVIAFYERVCNEWADRNAMSDKQRSDFLTGCMEDAPSVFPVGAAEDGGENDG